MKQAIFTGSAAAMVTPFDAAGKPDLRALGQLIDWQLTAGTSALVVCATTGECATLTDHEWETVVAYALHRADGSVPVLAGVGKNDTRHTLDLAVRAQKLGAQGVLAVTPYYNKTTQAGLIRHYLTVAEGANIPMLLYNVPSRTGLTIQPETYRTLSAHPNIYGTKEASGDFGLILKTRALCPGDFAIYSGNDDQIVPMLALGGLGVISTMANIIPAETAEICRLWQTGDCAGAAALQVRCQPLIEALFKEVNPIPVKTALEKLRRINGNLRLPLVPAGEECERALTSAMHAFGLL